MRITDEHKAAAQRVNIIDFLEKEHGFEFDRAGVYYRLKSDNSVTFYPPEKNRNGNWRYKDFSAGHPSAGDTIEFLQKYLGIPFVDAVSKLSTFAGYRGQDVDQSTHRDTAQRIVPAKKEIVRTLILPPRADKQSHVVAYLLKRGIDKDILYDAIKKKIIYEGAEHHNCVFVGHDRIGISRYAALRGTYNAEGTTPFKGEASGGDKRYGFCLRAANKDATKVVVLESAIDVLSYASLLRMRDINYKSVHILSLGCAADCAIVQFLADYPTIEEVELCLDNDIGGREATKLHAAKIKAMSKKVIDRPVPSGWKDANEYLQHRREEIKKKNDGPER